jgi:hypothetical protein
VLVPGTASGALKILTFYIQSVLLLVNNARIPWPVELRNLLHGTAHTGSLSATALECVVPGISEIGKYVVYTLTPLALVGISSGVYLYRRLRGHPDASPVFLYMTLSMLMTTYFGVTIKAFAGVSCTLPDGYSNMFPWLQCSSSNAVFRAVAGLSSLCLIVYTLGVPAVSALLLWRNRHRLDDAMVQRQLGFLYAAYRPGTYLWELLVVGRRLALALALTLVPFTMDQVSVVIIIVVLVGSLALQHAVSPFATVLENRLELLSLYALLFSFLGVYVAESSVDTPTPLTWLPVVVLVIIIATGVILFIVVFMVLAVRLLPRLRTAFGGRLIARSELLTRLVSTASDLKVRLLIREKETEETGMEMRPYVELAPRE